MPKTTKYLAEVIASFALVFFGTGAIVMNEASNGQIGNLGIALAFGAIVCIMILSLGHISGAHMNPAVSIAFWILRKLTFKELIVYLIAQLIGGIIASIVLRLLFSETITLGESLPSGSIWQSFFLELILSFFLMFVILFMNNQRREIKQFAAFAIGGTVFIEALIAGPICGASMNPMRSIAPALINANTVHLWAYIAAPIIGMILAIGCSKMFALEND
jgi:aquaporin NIP